MAVRTKETPEKRTTVTSSLNETSTPDQLGENSVMVLVRREALLRPPPPVYTAGFWVMVFKDDVNGFFLHGCMFVP
jgi:hypothetical protein